MSDQASAPDGEAPPTSCPVCLETWNSSDRLPKFLICHHSICVTCAGELQRTAKKRRPKPPPTEASVSNLRQLRASQESLGSIGTNVDDSTQETPSWVRCPMCRTRTFIEDPHLLQTNFYLRGLPRSVSMPRLVLWCETCSAVAAPECGDHKIEPVGEKMRSLQEELNRRTNALQGHVNESLNAHESHMEVYRWLCGMLRHSHSKVLAALTHAAQYHQALQHHTDALHNLVKRSENLQTADDPDESVKKLTSLLKELDCQQSAIINEVDLPILNDTFQILRTHQGPRGYGKALVVLDADRSVTLSIFGENDRQQASDSEDNIENESDRLSGPSSTLKRAMTLKMSRREKGKGRPKFVPLQKTALLKAAPPDLPHVKEDVQTPGEGSSTDPAHKVTKDVTSSESEEATPSAPPYDDKRDVTQEREGNEEVTKVLEQPIVAPETPIPKILPVTPEVITLPREGTFGRQTVNVSYRRYPPHLYDEEPIIEPASLLVNIKKKTEPANLLDNSKGQREPEVLCHAEEVPFYKDKAAAEVATKPSPSAATSRHRRHNREVREEEVATITEEPVTPRQRGRRRKKGKKRPSHSAVRRVDESDRHQKPRGRKQGRPRPKASARRASNSMCRVA